MIKNTYKGLTKKEAFEKYEANKNKIISKKEKNLFQRSIHILNTPAVYILLIVFITSLIVGKTVDKILISITIILNLIFTLIYENNIYQSLALIKKTSEFKSVVKRDGCLQKIKNTEIVEGDLVYFETGDFIPADLDIIEATHLEINEFVLSGNSTPIRKQSNNSLLKKNKNAKAYISTVVVQGKGAGIVSATGENAKTKKRALSTQNNFDVATPLVKTLKKLDLFLLLFLLAVCTFVIVVQFIKKESLPNISLVASTFIITLAPKGFFLIATYSMFFNVKNLIKQNIIIKNPSTAEKLSSVDIICSNIDGFVTQNKIRVSKFWFNNEVLPINQLSKEKHEILIHSLMLCNNAENTGEEWGNPIDLSLLKISSINKTVLKLAYPRIDEYPFSPERRLMTTVHNYKGDEIVFTKGAPDALLEKCERVLIDGYPCDIKDYLPKIQNDIKTLASETLKVIAIAYRRAGTKNKHESNLIFLGFVGIIDLPQIDAKESVLKAQEAGINVLFVTGDCPERAYAFAENLGVCNDFNQVITGAELFKLSPDELKEKISNYKVFACVLPNQKSAVINALKEAGHIVAVTGNNAGDAPVLEISDIGIVTEDEGKNVPREMASMIITDNSFSTIVRAIEKGRSIYQNIKKSIYYTLSGVLSDFIPLFVALLINTAYSFSVAQIIWVSLFLNFIPAIALSLDNNNPNLMKQLPRNKFKKLITLKGLGCIIFNGVFIGGMTVVAFIYGRRVGGTIYGQSIAFAVLGFAKLFVSFGFNALNHPVLNKSLFKNWLLWLSVIGTSLLHFLIIQLPVLNTIFKTVPLESMDWVLVAICVISALLTNKLYKSFTTPFIQYNKQKNL